MKVAVIGAGISGLVSLHNLADKPEVTELVCFEQGPHVGGLWNYTDSIRTGKDGKPVFSSIYKNLKTNLPKEFHSFPCYGPKKEFQDGAFLTSEQVLEYINDFADFYDLRKFIQFNTEVQLVDPTKVGDGKVEWYVSVKDISNNEAEVKQHVFDSVFVCNGKESVPYIPEIPGLSSFKGKVVHSRDFRVPETFTNLTVMVVGADFSGLEISMIIATKAKKVYICGRQGKPIQALIAVTNCDGIQSVRETSVVTGDGKVVSDVDALLFCTGYLYSYPFLSEKCNPVRNEERGRLFPLYKHVVHADWPTLMFISVPKKSISFRMYFMQSEFAVAALLGKVRAVHSRQEMLKDIEEDFEKRKSLNLAPHLAHHMLPLELQEVYSQSLVDQSAPGSITPIPKAFFRTTEKLFHVVKTDFSRYKSTTHVYSYDD